VPRQPRGTAAPSGQPPLNQAVLRQPRSGEKNKKITKNGCDWIMPVSFYDFWRFCLG